LAPQSSRSIESVTLKEVALHLVLCAAFDHALSAQMTFEHQTSICLCHSSGFDRIATYQIGYGACQSPINYLIRRTSFCYLQFKTSEIGAFLEHVNRIKQSSINRHHI
jgi:hypothetical protein